MTSPQPSARSPRGAAASALAAFAIVAAVAVVYWPGVHGFWGRDDFMQLAFARLIGTPWPLFVLDHYPPVPGSVFRPLGFASMWLCAQWFGTDYELHACADLALHVGVALALYGLLRRAGMAWTIALPCTLLFALHPAVIGTGLWWSARFDLLATLFILLALWAALVYRERHGVVTLAAALLAALAAMLSKEIGLAAIVPLTLLWAAWARHEPMQRGRALRAIALAWACGLGYLVWRGWVLGTASSGLTGDLPMAQAIARGLARWLEQAPGYLSFFVRLGDPARWVWALVLFALLIVIALAPKSGRVRAGWTRRTDLALCGLALLLVPAVLQAPVAALNAAPLQAGGSAIDAAMQSRLYYLGLAGVAIALAAGFDALHERVGPKLRVALVAPLLVGAFAFASVSHDIAGAFAARSVDIARVAREAVAAVDEQALPASPCHVVFLGVEPPPEWSIYVSMDSVVKALSADPERVKHCWFHADYVTYFHLMGAPVAAADALPYRPLRLDGTRVPWRRIGDLDIAYLDAAGIDARELARMRFLRHREGGFDDVSAEVAAGQIALRPQ